MFKARAMCKVRMCNEAFRAVVERRLTRMRWWSVAVLGMVILSNMNCNDVFLLPRKIKPLLTEIQQKLKFSKHKHNKFCYLSKLSHSHFMRKILIANTA